MYRPASSDISVAPIGVQTASSPNEEQCCAWRCNLTALSQHANLYFVAYADAIHVYMPQFPDQGLGGDFHDRHGPALVLTSPQTDPSRNRGLIDPRLPHAVNALLVRDLGTEEVLVAARDDGDIDAFWVRHVTQAIERRRPGIDDDTAPLGRFADDVRPFFSRNIGASAWGLAVHTAARVLAASCNTHQVSIFRFGLECDRGGSDDTSDTNSDQREFEDRVADAEHTVINGEANIPSIAFCNTGDDPNARWLLTTDIHGVCRIIDTIEPRLVQGFDFNPVLPSRRHLNSLADAGWIMAFLDRRAFRPAADIRSALGCTTSDQLHDVARTPLVWDVSRTIENLWCTDPAGRGINPDHATAAFPSSSTGAALPNGAGDIEASDSQESGLPDADESADAVEASDADEASDSDEAGGVSLMDIEQSTPAVAPVTNIDSAMSYRVQGGDDQTLSENMSASQSLHEQELASVGEGPDATHDNVDYIQGSEVSMPVNGRDEGHGHMDLGHESPDAEVRAAEDEPVDDEDDDEENNDSDLLSDDDDQTATFDGFDENVIVRERERLVKPSFFNPAALCEDLPCPILHASTLNIYMLQPSNQFRSRGSFRPPMLRFSSPLRPTLSEQLDPMRLFERLNMFAEILPLGLIVVASQKGRALVLSLNTIGRAGPAHSPKPYGTIYALRAESILPTPEQEKHGSRPNAPLLGIAASPLQGCEGRSQRWRLLLYYYNHSVLSYELRRSPVNDDAVDIERLVT